MVAGDAAYWREGRAIYERLAAVAAEVHEYGQRYEDTIWRGTSEDLADALYVLRLHRPELGREARP